MTRDEMRAYYAHFGEREWGRLTNAEGAVEFAVHRAAMARHLPPGARVLDIGGGPGRYTIWLAERGHRVVLADLSAELLAVARNRVVEADVGALIEEIVEADACELGRWADGSFDAALCMGPFYHLPDAGDRERATCELGRVVRPGGLIFVTVMPRYALFRRTLAIQDERHRLAQPEWVARLLEDGVFVNDVPGRFTGGYGVRPEDVIPFFEQHGFSALELLGSQSVTAGLEDALAQLASDDPVAYQAVLAIAVETASDPSILGMCSHLLYVGRKDL